MASVATSNTTNTANVIDLSGKHDGNNALPLFCFQVQLTWKDHQPVIPMYLEDMDLQEGQLIPTLQQLTDYIGTHPAVDISSRPHRLTYRSKGSSQWWVEVDSDRTLTYAMLVHRDEHCVGMKAYLPDGEQSEPSMFRQVKQECATTTMTTTPTVAAGTTKAVVAHKRKSSSLSSAVTATKTTTRSPRISASGSVQDRFLWSMLELKHGLQLDSPSRVWVAYCARYTNHQSAGFLKVLSAVKRQDYVTVTPHAKTITLTAAGLQAASLVVACSTGFPKTSTTNAEVLARIQTKLQPRESKLLQALADGQPQSRPDLAITIGYTNVYSAGFRKILGRLHKALGLVDYVSSGKDGSNSNNKKLDSVQLSNICFPFGRPKRETTEAVGTSNSGTNTR